MADLKKHAETHSTEDSYTCEVPGCQYKGKHYKHLESHFNTMHQVAFSFHLILIFTP